MSNTPDDKAADQDSVDTPLAGPWYRDGLSFECTQCGDCCTGGPGYVWVEEDEIRAIADYLDKPIGEIRLMNTRPAHGRVSLNEYANGDCVYFDPKKRGCTIYPARPRQCRTWPFWNSNLSSEADWKGIQKGCPGVGKGNFVPLEQIQMLAAEVDV
ncbi:MAG: YkgJ family cysteine cluster protein [Rhodopirellula sp.]|nr:YkgJ family cysteine cluster protein [Rhodopirellula sp.]